MRLITDALIIREHPVGEADKFITALTRERGILRASARGARNLKSRNAAATQLLSHSRLFLAEGRDKYIIQDAQPLHVFFDLRSDIEKLALAQYFCELAGVVCPREEPAEEPLRLLLNALHFLGNGQRDARLIKAVVELRLLMGAGYMPNLTGCSLCGRPDGPMLLMPVDGVLCCVSCGERLNRPVLPLSDEVLTAMRHILTGEFQRCFSFSLPLGALSDLAAASEACLLSQLGRSFQTLDFYHTVSS